ncbi:golvesin C-terminal-like domain-containing protein [Kribbella deserti]|uniref:Golvesin/Xly CBD-like domain-containing protein n=1 Tax=Kribbella deserti TaxID=1926257 RepID=A0ABV6QKU7_9ACTN
MRAHKVRFRKLTAMLVSGALAVTAVGSSTAAAEGPADVVRPSAPKSPGEPKPVDRVPGQLADKVLGAGWKSSKDRAWSLVGSQSGLHVLQAQESRGYAWKVLATLAESGFETDSWIGNGCITSSGRYLAVAYAPRTFTNDATAFDKAAFAAVVNLRTGLVRKLAVTTTLAYFNPGCGSDDQVVFAQYNHQGPKRTRIHTVSAPTGRVLRSGVFVGELTSAVPINDQVMAADGSRLVRLLPNSAMRTELALTGTVSRVRFAGRRNVVLSQTHGERTTVQIYDLSKRRMTAIATGPRTETRSHQGPSGRVFITGAKALVQTMPQTVRILRGKAGLQVADAGGLTIESVQRQGRDDKVAIAAVADTGQPVRFLLPSLRQAPAPFRSSSPALKLRPAAVAGEADTPIDPGATCAVPRNDVRTQVYQPNPRQVEWAVDQAVNNNLMTARPANWKQSGLPSYTPQLMAKFQLPALRGGGFIPPQVLLGILAQESNLWQASGRVIETWSGNPLIGNYYGRVGNGWSIDFSKADCGYGVGQITDGMRKGNTIWGGLNEQRAIAVDYTVNIAAAAKILSEKWNQLYDAGLLVNGGKSSRLESWFGAVWAYNSGFHPKSGTSEPWGLGWTNNPLSGLWDPARRPFLEYSRADAAHPQDWPYPEKIMGWAAYPLENPRLGATYRAAWWTDAVTSGTEKRRQVKPPLPTFCVTAVNDCVPTAPRTQNCPRADSKCWWYPPVKWKDCHDTTADTCGRGLVRFNTTYPEPQPDQAHTPPDPEQNPPVCNRDGIPSNSRVIDDVPPGVLSVRPQCGTPSATAGSFSLKFGAAEVNGTPVQYTSKIDFHQAGLGFHGHTWLTHTTWDGTLDQSRTVTGKWTLDQPMAGWGRVLVHLPEIATITRQAKYVVDRGDGRPPVARYVNTSVKANKWVSLGVFQFGAGRPSVTLSNRTFDAKYFDSNINPYAIDRQENIAWDAVAFQPLPAKPTIVAAAVGDSYGSGEGAGDYLAGTDHSGEFPLARSACHRSKNAWSRLVSPAGLGGQALGAVSDTFSPAAELSFVSCSGAVSENLSEAHDSTDPLYLGGGQHHEVAQIEAGYLDESTNLVFVSLGGNDAFFSKVLTFCVKSALNCPDNVMPGDSTVLDIAQRERITGPVQERVVAAIQRISVAAPNAQIVYAGYPRLLDGTAVACPDGLGLGEVSWINKMSDLLADTTAATLAQLSRDTGIRVTYVDTRPKFINRGACAGTDSAINFFKTAHTPGDNPEEPVSAESFHPNGSGTRLYVDAIKQKMGW